MRPQGRAGPIATGERETQTTDPGKATREMQPLVDYLSRKTSGPVQMTVPPITPRWSRR